MAEEKDKGGEGEAAEAVVPAVKSKKKLLIIVGSVVALLLVIGIPVGFFAMKKGGDPAEELASDAAHDESLTPEGAEDEDELDEGEVALGGIFPMETFVVNLQGSKLIRCQVQVEFNQRDIPRRFYSKMVPIRDAVISLIAARTADDVLTDKGRDGLKASIKDRMNEILHKELVQNVYFTQFVVQ